MFLLTDIQREYDYKNNDEIFDKLNDLTYNKAGKILAGNFVSKEPPTFELWYTNDIKYSAKPLSTKLTVTLHSFSGGVQVKASASSNKVLYIAIIIVAISLIVQLFRNFSLIIILPHVLCMPLAESQATATLKGCLKPVAVKNACISKLIASVWLLANGVQHYVIRIIKCVRRWLKARRRQYIPGYSYN